MIRCRPHISFPSLVVGVALLAPEALNGFIGMRPPMPPTFVQTGPIAFDKAPALLANYCAGCHQAGRSGIDLDLAADRRAVRRDRHLWEKVLNALHAEYMPPAKSPQPSAADR